MDIGVFVSCLWLAPMSTVGSALSLQAMSSDSFRAHLSSEWSFAVPGEDGEEVVQFTGQPSHCYTSRVAVHRYQPGTGIMGRGLTADFTMLYPVLACKSESQIWFRLPPPTR